MHRKMAIKKQGTEGGITLRQLLKKKGFCSYLHIARQIKRFVTNVIYINEIITLG